MPNFIFSFKLTQAVKLFIVVLVATAGFLGSGVEKVEAVSWALQGEQCRGTWSGGGRGEGTYIIICPALDILYFTLNSDQSTYSPGETIVLSGSVNSPLCSNYVFSYSLSASVDGGAVSTISNAAINGGTTYYVSGNLTAPTTPGTYSVAVTSCSFYIDKNFCSTSNIPITVTAPDPVKPACPYSPQDGRTIVEFDPASYIISYGSAASAMTNAFTTSLAAGVYSVILVGWDGYSTRASTDPVQPDERYYAQLENGGTVIAYTNASSDLADGVIEDTNDEQVQTNLIVSSAVTEVRAVHAAYPNSSPANSVHPVCAVFDLMAPVATLSGTACEIPVGESTCEGTLTWSISNVVYPNIYNWYEGYTVFSDQASGTSVPVTLTHGTNKLAARNGTDYINAAWIEGVCELGGVWNGSLCAPDAPPTSPTGSVSGTVCEIGVGERSCEGALTWNISDAIDPNLYNANGPTYSNNSSGNAELFDLDYGLNTVFVRDGVEPLANVELLVACASGSSWNGLICDTLPPPPPAPAISIAVDRELVRSGESVTSNIEVTAAYPATCTVYGVQNAPVVFAHSGTPATDTYSATTRTLTSSQIITVTCEAVPAIPGVADTTSETRVDVIPVMQEL